MDKKIRYVLLKITADSTGACSRVDKKWPDVVETFNRYALPLQIIEIRTPTTDFSGNEVSKQYPAALCPLICWYPQFIIMNVHLWNKAMSNKADIIFHSEEFLVFTGEIQTDGRIYHKPFSGWFDNLVNVLVDWCTQSIKEIVPCPLWTPSNHSYFHAVDKTYVLLLHMLWYRTDTYFNHLPRPILYMLIQNVLI